ncbi:histidine kinase [Nonomuraea sp. NPDC049152]|uniref:histidine kinase n=1 Tax=Nonomuraea sp. NPDC049152 TaxID=3154350 RepID=UPI0033C44CA5
MTVKDASGRPWIGWALMFGYIALLVPARFTIFQVMARLWERSSPLTSAIGLGLIVSVFALFAVAAMGRRWALPILAAVTFGAYVPFAMLWGPIAGPLAAAMPLTFAGPAGWLLFAGVMAADTLVAAVLHGSSVFTVASFTIIDLNTGLTLFALVRLAVLLVETHTANRQLAELKVADERLSAAADLRRAIGARLSRILTLSRRAPVSSDVLADTLADMARISREAAAEARAVAAVRGDPVPAHRADLPDASTGLARWFMIAMTASISIIVLRNVAEDTADQSDWAVALVVASLAAVLQLYHGVPRASAPMAWHWTLPAQILITGAATVYVGHGTMSALLSLAVANTLLWLPARWSVPIVGVVAVGAGQVLQLYPDVGGYALYQTASTIVIAIGVFAFNRLPEAAVRLRALRGQIARNAVIAERLRLARDVHDLLGFTLSAITLKVELGLRVLDDDPGKAEDLLREVGPLAARALSDVRSITAEGAVLSLPKEIDSARALLASAGVDIRVDASDPEELPVLATVLREAVTNVVRHSAARSCTISVENHGHEVRLRVTNDGHEVRLRIANDGHEVRLRVADDGVAEAVPATGSGLANLTARVEAAGGSFSAGDQGDGTFTLVASVPR